MIPIYIPINYIYIYIWLHLNKLYDVIFQEVPNIYIYIYHLDYLRSSQRGVKAVKAIHYVGLQVSVNPFSGMEIMEVANHMYPKRMLRLRLSVYGLSLYEVFIWDLINDIIALSLHALCQFDFLIRKIYPFFIKFQCAHIF